MVVERDESPGWSIADISVAEGVCGAVVLSAQRLGGVNLVLWRWSEDRSDGAHVRLIDPRGDLS